MRAALFGVFAVAALATLAVATPAQAAGAHSRHHRKAIRHLSHRPVTNTARALARPAPVRAAVEPKPATTKPVAHPDGDGLQSEFDRVGNG